MEGLEATEVRLSQINSSFRCEAEFFQKKYHDLNDLFNKVEKLSTLGELILEDVKTGHTPSMKNELYYGEDIAFIKTDNVREFSIKPAFTHYLSLLGDAEISSTHLKEDDIVITIIGATYDVIGRSSLIRKEDLPANINQNIALIRPNPEKILPHYLCAYLNSKYGREWLEYFSRQTGQVNLNCREVELLPIPLFTKDFQISISDIIHQAYETKYNAQILYTSAENYLLECLGMQDFVANPDAYNIKTLKESFLESGRIDAEYYLPKNDDYFKAISAYTGGVAPLCEVCTIRDGNYTPEAKQAYRYIELANIGKSGDIIGCTYENGEDLPTRARRIVSQGDVIVSSIEGSLGSCALVTEDYDHALCSTGFYVVRSSQINSETLLTLFKSEPIQQLLKKGCSGTILTGIGKQEFEQIPIPLIRPEVQEEIAQHIQRSFALRKEASKLLEEAKLSVEQAIGVGGGKLLIYSDLQRRSEQEERLAMYLLLKDLGLLAEKSPRTKVVATEKKLSASFFASGRLDAEYYQPKYDYLDSQLAQLPTQRLGEIVGIQKSIEPGSEAYQTEGIPFVRVSDFNKFGLETPSVCLDRATYATALRPQKDTILLSKDGSVGIAYKVENDTDVITSGAILHLLVKAKGVLPDYLTLVLNSPIVKMQAERDAGGSIIQHWKPSEIEQVVIPILAPDIQQKLSERVSKSFALRREANALLAEAKAMVERAIEATA